MGNNSSSVSLSHYESVEESPKRTGIVSFDTLRLLYQQKKRQVPPDYTEDARIALYNLATREQQYLSVLIEEVAKMIEKLPAVNMKTFMFNFTDITNHLEVNLRDKVLDVYKTTQQYAKAIEIEQKGVKAGIQWTFNGDPESLETMVNHKFLDRIRLQLAWFRELSNVVISCTSTNREGGALATYEIQFANLQNLNEVLMDRALHSLTPVPGVKAIVEWSVDRENKL